MRKILVILLILPLAAVAQVRFGYLNYSEAQQQVPQYKEAQAHYNELLKRCEQELLRNEEELTRNYVSFLDGQREFPEPILRKRQKELQDHVDRSIQFREEVKKWLVQAHDSLFAPVNAIVDDAIARVCMHNGLAYVINLEEAGYLFVNPAMGLDVTKAVVNTILKNGEPQIIQATDGRTFILENRSVITDSIATDSTTIVEQLDLEVEATDAEHEAVEGAFH
ncbi:MAG: OmpH family outer membrane protein [Bacteroidaceae bacterium]|nr:OmpH family outer membrane protein [Bacteroidaceae bacterium]